MANAANPKQGRPREYTLIPHPDIPNQNLAIVAAVLNELRERVIDQVIDLPQDALSFCPTGTDLSIGALVVHLVWAEAGWINSITGCEVPQTLHDDINAIGQALPAGETPPPVGMKSVELVELCHRIGDEVTVPALKVYQGSIDTVIIQDTRRMTPRGVLMHLIWHWTYHSAHIGLLREQWGSDYRWTFGSLGA
jgi:uncharacterized damage-inducible protein DinB